MKRLVVIIVLAFIVSLTPALGQAAVAGDVSSRSISIETRGSDFTEIILTLSMMNKLPTGFQQTSAASPECEKKRDVVFPNRVQVRMLMSFLMPDCPAYSWSGGKVLSVFPKAKEASVLDVVIPEFAVEELNPEEALDLIFESPEVRRYLKDQKVSRSTAHKSLINAVAHPQKYRFAFTKKSVRDMLDHIVTTTGYKIWIHQGPIGSDREINVRVF